MYNDQDISLSILVVDDNEVNTMILAKMLNMFKVNIDQTFSGKNAVKLYRKRKYDIIFIDHLMPEMNGIMTTMAIRKLEKGHKKTLIFILSASNTEEIRTIYRKAGADGVFQKPLKLNQLVKILKKWFPQVNFDVTTVKNSQLQDTNRIMMAIENIEEINYKIGMKYALGKPEHFLHILRLSMKDIQKVLDMLNNNHKTANSGELKATLHSLKSVFSNIGGMELLEETITLEHLLTKESLNPNDKRLTEYINHLKRFLEKLNDTVRKCEKVLPQPVDTEVIPMTKEEYEQCISNTIYYIKCYEYDSIINEIEKLTHTNNLELKIEFNKALEEIKEFNYEKALIRIQKIVERESQG